MKNGTCRGCGASIVWITTPKGKSMPCDAKAVYYKMCAKGKDKIVTPNGVIISCNIVSEAETADGVGYVPHWSSCPNADNFRKKKEKE